MVNHSNMRKKIKVLEKQIMLANEPPRTAIRFSDGIYEFNEQVFETQELFENKVDRLFRNRPPDPDGSPQVLVLGFNRPYQPFKDRFGDGIKSK